MTDPGLISVRTRVVLDTLVGSITETVLARLDEPLPPAVETDLAATAGDARLVRMGYLARAVEVERFERAREQMPWLADRLARAGEAVPALAAELAEGEPVGRPEPGDAGAVTWTVPGPGGHVRHYLAAQAADAGGERLTAAAKRSWVTGFLIHCIGEAAPET